MFNGVIDSRQVQRGSSSQSSDSGSTCQRRTTSELEMESLRQELARRDAFLKAQEEYQKQQQAHQERLHAQQMAAIEVSINVHNCHSYRYQNMPLTCCIVQALYRAQGIPFVVPEVAPPPAPPQWGSFAQMSFSPSAQVMLGELYLNLLNLTNVAILTCSTHCLTLTNVEIGSAGIESLPNSAANLRTTRRSGSISSLVP